MPRERSKVTSSADVEDVFVKPYEQSQDCLELCHGEKTKTKSTVY